MPPVTLNILDNIFLQALHVMPPITLNILENIFMYSLYVTKSVLNIFKLLFINVYPDQPHPIVHFLIFNGG